MKWLTVGQFAETMQVPEKTVRQWCRDGVLRAKKFGRSWRIHPSEAE